MIYYMQTVAWLEPGFLGLVTVQLWIPFSRTRGGINL